MNLCISSSFASPNVHLQNPERATQIGSSQLGVRCAVKTNSSEESIVGGKKVVLIHNQFLVSIQSQYQLLLTEPINKFNQKESVSLACSIYQFKGLAVELRQQFCSILLGH